MVVSNKCQLLLFSHVVSSNICKKIKMSSSPIHNCKLLFFPPFSFVPPMMVWPGVFLTHGGMTCHVFHSVLWHCRLCFIYGDVMSWCVFHSCWFDLVCVCDSWLCDHVCVLLMVVLPGVSLTFCGVTWCVLHLLCCDLVCVFWWCDLVCVSIFMVWSGVFCVCLFASSSWCVCVCLFHCWWCDAHVLHLIVWCVFHS